MTEQELVENVASRVVSVLNLRGLGVLISELQAVGTVAIFGGLARDMFLMEPRAFSGDVDIVVSARQNGCLHAAVYKYRPRRTSLGGYRLDVAGEQVDVWELQDTWAFRCRDTSDIQLSDILCTPYFSRDAVLCVLAPTERYRVVSSCILLPSTRYIADMRKGQVDLVNASVPCSASLVARAVSLLLRQPPFTFTAALAADVNKRLSLYTPKEIAEASIAKSATSSYSRVTEADVHRARALLACTEVTQ